ncbi:MAG: hypothetical protein ACFWUM_05320 [Eubacteriales bacterium]|jgi:hypothetical protein
MISALICKIPRKMSKNSGRDADFWFPYANMMLALTASAPGFRIKFVSPFRQLFLLALSGTPKTGQYE